MLFGRYGQPSEIIMVNYFNGWLSKDHALNSLAMLSDRHEPKIMFECTPPPAGRRYAS